MGKVARLPCIICLINGRRGVPAEVAHIKVGFPEAGWRAFGHAERAHDWRTAPICSVHHRTGSDAQHRNPWGDERAWWAYWGIYPPEFCAALVEAFARGDSGARVVEDFAERARRACQARRDGL